MRAAVMREKELVVADIAEPTPGPGQVLVDVIACGICGSDLHALKFPETMIESAGASGVPFVFDLGRDIVMGHEFSARVVETGPGVTNVGTRDVVVSMPVMIGADGFAAIGYSNQYNGAYAERMLLTAALCLKVPDGLDPRHAALTEPMAVGLHAVVKSGIKPGEAALVYGCGPVGLACIAALRLAGIEPIVAADFSPARRELARTMGAHEAVDPKAEAAIDAWRRVDGAKPLVMFEAVGVPGMLDRAFRDAQRNTRILVVGVCMERDTVWPMLGINKELTVQFALGYTPEEFSRTLDSIAKGQIDVAPLITGEVGIAGVPEAFRTLASPDAHAKILVEPALG
jgi:2-desacetyl-2-hydroxyethyl bacteriochlorophyllide A dehydrogenase